MDTSGGFLLPSSDGADADGLASGSGSAHSHPRAHRDGYEDGDGDGDGGRDGDGLTPIPNPKLKKLTTRQERRLMDYLDDRFLEIGRGYRKRYNPSTTLPTLTTYLAAWRHVLSVLASIPPIGSSAALLVSYYLRMTSEFCDGIAGYRLEPSEGEEAEAGPEAGEGEGGETEAGEARAEAEGAASAPSANAARQLNEVLSMLDLLDRFWTAILHGHLIDMQRAQAYANASHGISSTNANTNANAKAKANANTEREREDPSSSTASHVAPFSARFEAPDLGRGQSMIPDSSLEAVIDGRFRSDAQAGGGTGRGGATAGRWAPDSVPFEGGRGTRTVGQTDRVRLRNICADAKEHLFAWIRLVLDAPPPPTIWPDEAAAGSAVDGPAGREDGLPALSRRGVETDLKEQADIDQPEERAELDRLRATGRVQAEEGNEANAEDEAEMEMEMEMEEVDIGDEVLSRPQVKVEQDESDNEEEPQVELGTEENRHFQNLFDRKLDPDASDEEEEEEDEQAEHDVKAEEEPEPIESNDKDNDDGDKISASAAAVQSSPKRKREIDSPQPRPPKPARAEAKNGGGDDERRTNVARPRRAGADKGREHQRPVVDNILQWDMAANRIFNRTLRTLSDISGGHEYFSFGSAGS